MFGKKGKSHAHLLMNTSLKINSNPTSNCVDSTLSRNMLGSLLYISIGRPDIAFSVGVYAKF